jgi:hypothetical protein
MIFTLIIGIIYAFIWAVTSPLRLLDDVVLSGDIASSITAIKPYYMALDPIFPITVLIVIIGLEIAFELAYFAYIGIKWVYTKIPFLN